MSGISRKN